MNDTDSQGNPTQDFRHGSAVDFDAGLKRARTSLEKGQIDDALKILGELEQDYVRASAIFETLGDAFLAKGNVSEGIRYKTLHQILKGTFRIVREESARGKQRLQEPPYISRDLVREATDKASLQKEAQRGEHTAEEEVVPVTLSMAQELMRQGHYDRASSIFDRLLRQNPDEDSLKQARDLALRKRRDKHLLNILQRWLTNIEQIRSGETTVR